MAGLLLLLVTQVFLTLLIERFHTLGNNLVKLIIALQLANAALGVEIRALTSASAAPRGLKRL